MPAGPSRRARLARAAGRVLGRRRLPARRLALPALLAFALALVVRLAYVGDAAPALYTWQQHGVRMAFNYTEAARAIQDGDGILYPREWPDPSETRLVSRPPGYPAFLAAVYGTLGPSYADVLAAQAVLTALLPVALLLLVTRLAGAHAGIAAGLLAALSAPLGYHASIVTPDGLSALLAVLITVLVWRARRGRAGARAAWLAAAGASVGVATWLRPNFVLLAPLLALATVRASPRSGRRWLPAVVMVAVAIAVVLPITVRNARLYGAFVPVSANGGIVLWEGIADAGGERFGARSRDLEVAAEEAVRFGDPRYAKSWATPDGILRDRDRTRRSLEVIRAHPGWYAASVARRSGDVLMSGRAAPRLEPRPPALAPDSSVVDHPAVRADAALGAARPALRALQRLAAWSSALLTVVGLAVLALAAPRRALILALVPVYVLLVQSPMHFEARFALPKDAFTPAFAGVGLAVALGAAVRRARRYWM